MRLLPRPLAATLAGAAIALVPTIAEARPQWSAQTQFGAVGIGNEDGAWKSTRLDLGLKVEAMYLRNGPNDFGLGPYVEMRTAAFVHGDYGGGLVGLLPVSMTFPIWFGAGGFARRQESTWAPGFNAFLAWGGRSFNYHSDYAMAFGLVADVRVHRGDFPGVDVVIAASIDLEAIAIPFMYVISAIRH
jgi:hypothetical protein